MFSLTQSDRPLVREPPIAFWDLDHEIAYEDITDLIAHYHVHKEKWVKRKKQVATVLEVAFAVASLAAMVVPLFYGHLWWIGFPIFFGGGLLLMLPSSLLKSHAKKQERIHAGMCQERQMLSSCGRFGKYPLSVFNLPEKELLDREHLISDRMKADEMNSQKRGNRLSQKKDPHGRIYPKSSSPLRTRGLAALDLAETVASKHQRAGVGHLLDPLEEEVWQRKKKAIKEARSYDGTEEVEKEVSRWAWFQPHWKKAKEANSVQGVAQQTLKEPSMLFQAVDGVNSEQKRLYEETRVRQIPLINPEGDEVDALDQAYKVLTERVAAFWTETQAKQAEAVGAPYFERRYESLEQAIRALPNREEITDRNALLSMKKQVVAIEQEAKGWREELPVHLLNELEAEIKGLETLHQILQAAKEDKTLSFDFDEEYAAVQAEFARLKICCTNERVYGERRYYEMMLSEISRFRKEQLKPLAVKVAGERNEHTVLAILRGVGQGCKKMAKALVFRFDNHRDPDLVLKTSTFGVQTIGSKNRSINTLLFDADKKLTRWLYVNQLWVKVVALIINVVFDYLGLCDWS